MKRFQLSVLTIVLMACFSAWSVTEQEYLLKNKSYTDGLIEFFKNEDITAKKLATLKTGKKNTEAQLKTETANLASTTKKLTSEQSNLSSLQDKQLNKAQLESSLKSQKQQNINKIDNLQGQIDSTNQSLQNVNFTVSQLQNEKSLLVSQYNTQSQVVTLSENTVTTLESEIRQLNLDIDRARAQIQRLNNQIDNLELKKSTEVDPAIKAQIQAEIQLKRTEKQNLKSDIDFSESRLSTKKFQLISAESDLSRERTKLSSLKIQLDGKQSELQSQINLKDSLKSKLDNLQSQKASLVSKNKSINSELDVLANLPFYISESQTKIQALTQTQGQQNTAVQQTQAALTAVSTDLATTQQQVDTLKATVLAEEKEHDAILKEFLPTVLAVTPTILPEGTLSIDSLLVVETVATYKDWSVFKGTSTTLDGANVCVASTQVLDSVSGVVSELMVVKLGDALGGYSSPFILTTHSRIADLVVKGQLKTNSSKSILLPLLQSPVANEKALVARYSDTANLISYLKAHSTAKVEFTVPGAPVSVPFSLRGSSDMVSKMLSTCVNN